MLKKQGYTIIELLVGLVILGLLMQIGLASYREFNRRQLAVSVARQLEGDLRLAQQHANSATKPAGFVCGDPESYAGVLFDMSSQVSYSLSTACSDGSSVQIKAVNLPQETVLVRPADHDIIFKPLARGTDLSAETVIGVCAYGTEKSGVKVTPAGEISPAEITSCTESGGGGGLPWWAQLIYDWLGQYLFCLIFGSSFPGVC